MLIHTAFFTSLYPKIHFTHKLKAVNSSDSESTALKDVPFNSQMQNDLNQLKKKRVNDPLTCSNKFCFCCSRRDFMTAVGAAALLPMHPSNASADSSSNDPMAMLNRLHPPRPDWYEEFYATAMNTSMKSYEAEIEGYKSELFANLRGKAKQILEIGIGTGPNLKYYANEAGASVYGVDPNRKMEKYAQAAADAAGLPPANFKFFHAISESLPLRDASVDAVIGTLVLCSVADVNLTLQEVRRVLKPGGIYLFVEHVAAADGTVLRFIQGLLDPLQQTLADGCHLTRKTGENITKAGFSDVDIHQAVLSTASLINPHIIGIARK